MANGNDDNWDTDPNQLSDEEKKKQDEETKRASQEAMDRVKKGDVKFEDLMPQQQPSGPASSASSAAAPESTEPPQTVKTTLPQKEQGELTDTLAKGLAKRRSQVADDEEPDVQTPAAAAASAPQALAKPAAPVVPLPPPARGKETEAQAPTPPERAPTPPPRGEETEAKPPKPPAKTNLPPARGRATVFSNPPPLGSSDKPMPPPRTGDRAEELQVPPAVPPRGDPIPVIETTSVFGGAQIGQTRDLKFPGRALDDVINTLKALTSDNGYGVEKLTITKGVFGGLAGLDVAIKVEGKDYNVRMEQGENAVKVQVTGAVGDQAKTEVLRQIGLAVKPDKPKPGGPKP